MACYPGADTVTYSDNEQPPNPPLTPARTNHRQCMEMRLCNGNDWIMEVTAILHA
jgi:hypothetical protein